MNDVETGKTAQVQSLKKNASSARKIKIAIVGGGRIADVHFPGYINNPRAQLYAVCDVNPEIVTQRQQQWQCQKSFTNLATLLQDPKLDAVEILTPQHLHLPMVLAAARAGKHIALQKPMTTDLKKAMSMIEATNKAQVVFKITDNYLFYPPIVFAKKLIDQGRIGQPSGLRIKLTSGGKGGWSIPSSSWQWRLEEKKQGRGMQTFDHGHHLWTTAWYLLGHIKKVKAWIDYADGIIDCPATVIWKYQDHDAHGVCEYQHAAELTIPSLYYANDEWLEITGRKGIIFIHRCTGTIHGGPAVSLFSDQGFEHFNHIASDWLEGFKGSLENFCDAIEKKAEPSLNGRQGYNILKLSLAIAQSARKGREVYVSEMDHCWPYLHYRRERKAEMRQINPKKFSWPWSANEERFSGQAKDLTMALLERFDPLVAGHWQIDIMLSLLGQAGADDIHLLLHISNKEANIRACQADQNADLIIEASAGCWAMILLKKKRIEVAFMQNKLRLVKGKAEDALKLRNVFKLNQ